MNFLIEKNPLVCTIFSCPNYMGKGNNKGGYVVIKNNSFQTKSFQTVSKKFVIEEFVLNFGNTSLFKDIIVVS